MACIVPWYEILCNLGSGRRWLVWLVAGDGVSIGGLGPIILMSLRTAEMNMSEAIGDLQRLLPRRATFWSCRRLQIDARSPRQHDSDFMGFASLLGLALEYISNHIIGSCKMVPNRWEFDENQRVPVDIPFEVIPAFQNRFLSRVCNFARSNKSGQHLLVVEAYSSVLVSETKKYSLCNSIKYIDLPHIGVLPYG